MIKIKDKWPTHRFGPCRIAVETNGWLQRQTQSKRVKLEVTIAQHRWSIAPGIIKRQTLEGVVDTGSPCTIISRKLFENAGFRVPSEPATNLRLSGVVRRKETDPETEAYLWGWPGVEVHACLPHGMYGEKLKLPTCKLGAVIADNVDDGEFLLGLDFLRRFPVLLDDGLIVMLVR